MEVRLEGASEIVAFELAGGEERLVAAGPLVFTSVMACELTGADAATVLLATADGGTTCLRLRLRPGETVSFADRLALPSGLRVVCQTGEVAVMVGCQ